MGERFEGGELLDHCTREYQIQYVQFTSCGYKRMMCCTDDVFQVERGREACNRGSRQINARLTRNSSYTIPSSTLASPDNPSVPEAQVVVSDVS